MMPEIYIKVAKGKKPKILENIPSKLIVYFLYEKLG